MPRRLTALNTEEEALEYLEYISVLTKKRTSLKMTQGKLAAKSGVAVDSIRNIETFKQNPTLLSYLKLCKALGFKLLVVPDENNEK